jgi:DegV family protein with EDD domain
VAKIRIVVDSGVDFMAPSTIERYQVTVVPHSISFGPESYQDASEMDAEKFFQHLSHNVPHPAIEAPTAEQYAEVYKQLSRSTDQILSLHTSRTLSSAWENAKTAAQGLLGRCEIAVMDSLTVSAGLGMLVEIAALAAETSTSLEDVVRLVRSAVGHSYSIFYVDSMDFIQKKGLLSPAQAMLGTMLGIKPFLTIEEGHLITIEKVRTRSQAVEKLVEFVLEFAEIEKMVILQSSPFIGETTRVLQDRLTMETGRRSFPTLLYGPTLASYLGTDATGIIVMESGYE